MGLWQEAARGGLPVTTGHTHLTHPTLSTCPRACLSVCLCLPACLPACLFCLPLPAEFNDIQEASANAGNIRMRDVSVAADASNCCRGCRCCQRQRLMCRRRGTSAPAARHARCRVHATPVCKCRVALPLLQSWRVMFTRPYSPMLVVTVLIATLQQWTGINAVSGVGWGWSRCQWVGAAKRRSRTNYSLLTFPLCLPPDRSFSTCPPYPLLTDRCDCSNAHCLAPPPPSCPRRSCSACPSPLQLTPCRTYPHSHFLPPPACFPP